MKFQIAALALVVLATTADAQRPKRRNRDLLLKRNLASNPLLSGANPKVTYQPGCFDWGTHLYE